MFKGHYVLFSVLCTADRVAFANVELFCDMHLVSLCAKTAARYLF